MGRAIYSSETKQGLTEFFVFPQVILYTTLALKIGETMVIKMKETTKTELLIFIGLYI